MIEIESQTEYTNQKHRTAKHVLPFQIFEVRLPPISIEHTGLPLQIQYFNFFGILIEKPAHTSDSHQWAPGQGTSTQSYLQHFEMLSLRLVGMD